MNCTFVKIVCSLALFQQCAQFKFAPDLMFYLCRESTIGDI